MWGSMSGVMVRILSLTPDYFIRHLMVSGHSQLPRVQARVVILMLYQGLSEESASSRTPQDLRVD